MKPKSPTDFHKILEDISRHHGIRQVFDGFIRLSACALAVQTREKEYLEEAARWEKSDLDLFGHALGALVLQAEAQPFTDLLGQYYMEYALSQKGQQWTGEFHTPKPICDLMARLTIASPESFPAERPITVCEPACGSGAMILSFGEACSPDVRRRLRVTAIDVSRSGCDMTFINTTLWGIPTRVIHGNTLTMEYWAAWSNIHFIAPWLPLALRPQAPEAMEQGNPPKPFETERIKASLQQQELPL
jgi:type I restriction-modification system DNA methylase subunit